MTENSQNHRQILIHLESKNTYGKVNDPPLPVHNIHSSITLNTDQVIENEEETDAKETNQYQETNLEP